ncbi:MAG: hypothetical protein KIT60_03550 [Burkholderiaceae bacterium]|nr:hypothetical protein [Burkholderiaceae bacterium]
MEHAHTITQPPGRRAARLGIAITLMTATCTALAVDGCLVLLCLAAPDWRKVVQCVPPVQQALRDLARGRPFPECKTGGAGNQAAAAWANAPDNCPPQYTRAIEGESTTTYACDYTGVVTVTVEGTVFTRTWWNMGGDSVTEYTSTAKTVLKSWDTRFDDEYAVWFSAQPKTVPVDLNP